MSVKQLSSQHQARLSLLEKTIPLVSYRLDSDELSIYVKHEDLIPALMILKNHIGFRYNLLTCVSGVDFPGYDYRFCVVYDLLSITHNHRIRVKTFVTEIETANLHSATAVFECASWWEREVWDMYGIYFRGHPDLRRILTDYGFEGHPLRKDFPLSGYFEARYDQNKKRVVFDPVEFAQEYRSFNYEMPW